MRYIVIFLILSACTPGNLITDPQDPYCPKGYHRQLNDTATGMVCTRNCVPPTCH